MSKYKYKIDGYTDFAEYAQNHDVYLTRGLSWVANPNDILVPHRAVFDIADDSVVTAVNSGIRANIEQFDLVPITLREPSDNMHSYRGVTYLQGYKARLKTQTGRSYTSSLKESSVGRMNQHLTEDKNFAIISPCKNGDSKEEHKKNLAKLKNEVYNKYNLGFIELVSKWVDEEGNVFDEYALFVPNMSKKVAMRLGEEYSQCSVIVCDDGKCEEICTTPFDKYSVGDIVKTFNLSSDTPMNIALAKSILDKSNMGAVSVTRKGGIPFTLTELLEVIPARASVFEKEEIYNRIYCEEFAVLPIGNNTVAKNVVKEELKDKYNLLLTNLDSTNGIVYGLSKKRAEKICEKYSLPYFAYCDGSKAVFTCTVSFDGFTGGDTLCSFDVLSNGKKNITESVVAHCSKFSRLVEGLEESKRYRDTQRALFGDPSGRIKTFAIVSPENPIGALGSEDEDFRANFLKYVENPNEYNKERLDNLKRELVSKQIQKTGDTALKYGAFRYIPLKGHYGDSERSFMIFNLTLKDAKTIARDYGQESFFFANVFPDHSDIGYFLTDNHCKTYELKEISRTITDETDADDFFSKFGSKFRINMKEFGDEIPEVTDPSSFDESFNDDISFMSRASSRRDAIRKTSV